MSLEDNALLLMLMISLKLTSSTNLELIFASKNHKQLKKNQLNIKFLPSMVMELLKILWEVFLVFNPNHPKKI